MKTFYHYWSVFEDIAEVEAVRETEKMVCFATKSWDGKVGERKELKEGRYFETRQEAIDHKIKVLRMRIDDEHDRITKAQMRLEKLQDMLSYILESKP